MRLWDVAKWHEVGRFPGRYGSYRTLAFSRDGKKLAAGSSSQPIELWDVATRTPLHAAEGHWAGINHLAYTPNGKILASCSHDGTVRFWDPRTGQELRQLLGHESGVERVAFTPDGKLLASSSTTDKTVRLWQVDTGQEVRRFTTERNDGYGLTFSPDGQTLVCSKSNGSIELWTTATGQLIGRLQRHGQGPVRSVAFTPDSKNLISGGHDCVIRAWDVANQKQLRQIQILGAWVWQLALSPDGRYLVSVDTDDGDPVLRDVATGQEVARLGTRRERVRTFAFSPDSKMLACVGRTQAITLWELATRRERCQFPSQSGSVSTLAFAPDGKTLASGNADSTMVVWNVGSPGTLAAEGVLTEGALAAHWANLIGPDARTAYQSICTLKAVPHGVVAFLKQRMYPGLATERQSIQQWIVELDNNQFKVRDRATKALTEIVDRAELDLRKALADNPSAELRLRIEQILQKLDPARPVRAVEVLEHIGSAEAIQLLAEFTQGTPDARLTQEAKASLERLRKRDGNGR